MLEVRKDCVREDIFRKFMPDEVCEYSEPSWYSWNSQRKAYKDGYSSGFWAARRFIAKELVKNYDKLQEYLKDVDTTKED